MREAAAFIAGRSASAEAGLLGAALQFGRQAFRRLRNRRLVVRLSELDDHMLADLGLTRRDVDVALTQPFPRDPSAELEWRVRRNSRQSQSRRG